MGKYQVLLVEDDAPIREVVTDYFHAQEEKRFHVECAENGVKALELLAVKKYDIVFLDIMLPGINGLELCKRIRCSDALKEYEINESIGTQSTVPILFLTARGQEEDRLYGYQLGCDDYMVKPFSIAELYAKTKVLLKRVQEKPVNIIRKAGDIRMNEATFEVYVKDTLIALAPKEYALLKCFLNNPNMVLTRDVLLDRVWGYDYTGTDRVVDNHIKKLRKALKTAGRQIKTVTGQGYRLM